jgi:hypothetical protein
MVKENAFDDVLCWWWYIAREKDKNGGASVIRRVSSSLSAPPTPSLVEERSFASKRLSKNILPPLRVENRAQIEKHMMRGKRKKKRPREERTVCGTTTEHPATEELRAWKAGATDDDTKDDDRQDMMTTMVMICGEGK